MSESVHNFWEREYCFVYNEKHRKKYPNQISKKGKKKLKFDESIQASIMDMICPHAWKRMSQRAVSLEGIIATILYGSVYHGMGAEIFVIGRKECLHSKFDLSSFRGIHVVFSEGRIRTTYINRTDQLRYRR